MNSTAIWFVLVPVGLALLTNGLLAMNADTLRPKRKRNPYLPAGWLIGTIWVILFGLLGYTAYLVKANAYLLTFIFAVIAYCLAYPALTNLDPTSAKTRLLNAGAFILATLIVIVLYAQNQTNAIAFAAPLWLWASYVNIADIAYDDIGIEETRI